MTPLIPMLDSSTPNSGTGSTSSTPQSAPSNTLGPNSFITLLTAQLKTQDPLNPMDPNQMVTELTAINTLQQIVQIRTDLDTLVGALPPGQSGTGAPSTSATTSATNAAMPTAAKLNYLVNSQINSQLNSNSQSF